jgi:hypothetical protein
VREKCERASASEAAASASTNQSPTPRMIDQADDVDEGRTAWTGQRITRV